MAGSLERQRLAAICSNGNLKDLEHYLKTEPNAQSSINEPVGGHTIMHEAAISGNAEILRMLLLNGGQVNALSTGRHSPLHITASSGDIDCIRVLLEFHANVLLVNENGKTPSATAKLNSQKEAARILKTAEIKVLAGINATDLEETIAKLDVNEDIEPNCFDEALKVAVAKDNHKSAGILVINGASNIEQCLCIALPEENLSLTAALLWLCHATKCQDIELMHLIFEGIRSEAIDYRSASVSETSVENVCVREYYPEIWDGDVAKRKLCDLRKAVGSIDVKILIRIAVVEEFYEIAKIIVFEIYCNSQESQADWSGLRLTVIKESWIDEIQNFKNLSLAKNGLIDLPKNLISMKDLVKLDLSNNSITQIPKEIFELPLLKNLNLSQNRIEYLPDVDEWSKSLKFLYLKSNKLDSVPESIGKSELEDLDLSNNNLNEIQECICSIKNLSNLDISGNHEIIVLPPALAKLKRLISLGIRDMDQIIDPAPAMRKTMIGLLQHLKAKWRNSEAYYTMKLMLVGLANHGKTTLMHRLDEDYEYDTNLSTTGIDIKEITITRKHSFVFKCWDFAGQEDYYATHQCFLSQRSLYVLVWKVTDREDGIADMKQWLDNLETRVPYSTVIIVGTHLDMISDDEVEDGFEATMNTKVRDLISTYQKIICPENAITMVTCSYDVPAVFIEYVSTVPEINLKNELCTRTIENLRDIIYSVAEKMTVTGKPHGPKIMGEMVPSSYLSLANAIERHRVESQENNEIPILQKFEFEEIVRQNAQNTTRDIFDPDDVDIASRFLNDIGIIIHYDDPNQHLNDLYFIDPPWLCDLMAKIVTVKEAQSFVKDGVLYIKDIEFIIGKDDTRFPKELYPQYMRLLFRFRIGWRIDESRILIPSQLPTDFPSEEIKSLEPPQVLHRLHSFMRIPRGFWSRFIGRFVLFLKDVLTINVDLNANDGEDLDSSSSNEKIEEFNEPTDVAYLFRNEYLRCWRRGIVFSHPKLFLSVQPISFEGSEFVIETRVSKNLFGYRALCYIVDHIRTLVNEWYPGLNGDDGTDPYILQLVCCPICIDKGFQKPFTFDVRECLRLSVTQESVTCSEQHIPDVVSLKQLCPDVMFMDLPSQLRLNPLKLSLQTDECLGKGQYGEVYKGTYEGKSAAIKLSNAIEGNQSGLTDIIDNFYNMRQEVIILSKVFHPNIIKFLGVAVRPKLCSVIELAERGSLRQLIKGEMDPVERILIYRIAQQIANALSYLHQVDIVHRDLKPDNILIFSTNRDADLNVKVTDFGTANFMSCTGLKSVVGSPGFEAPELLMCLDEYTAKVDVYSFAIVLYEMITRRRPFHWITEDVRQNINRLVQQKRRPRFGDVECTKFGFLSLSDLMLTCWQQEASKRPSTQSIFQQLKAPCFCLLYGRIPLEPIQNPRQLYFLKEKKELWVPCADFSRAAVVVVDMLTSNTRITIRPTRNPANHEYSYFDGMKMVDENEVVVMLRAPDNDYAVFYSKNDGSFLRSCELVSNHLKILAITEKYAFIHLKTGDFVWILKSDLVNGNLTQLTQNILLSDKPDISVVITERSHMLVGCDDVVYKFDLNSQETVRMVINETTQLNRRVSNLVVSSDALMLFISFKESSEISCYFIQPMSLFGSVDCFDIIQMLTPQQSIYSRRVTCLCQHADTLWVGTGTGHVLIYEILPSESPKFITWIQPYKSEVTCMTVCNSVGSEMINFVVTSGEKLNPNCLSHNLDGICKLTTSFPVDDSLSLDESEEYLPQESDNVLLIWDAIRAATLRKLCSLD